MSVCRCAYQAEKESSWSKAGFKSIDRNLGKEVYIAKDTDQRVIEPLIQLCKSKDIEVIETNSMLKLGRSCGIYTGAAAVAVLKD